MSFLNRLNPCSNQINQIEKLKYTIEDLETENKKWIANYNNLNKQTQVLIDKQKLLDRGNNYNSRNPSWFNEDNWVTNEAGEKVFVKPESGGKSKKTKKQKNKKAKKQKSKKAKKEEPENIKIFIFLPNNFKKINNT